MALNSEYSKMYNTLAENQKFDEIDSMLKANLEKGMMILSDDVDELEMIKAQYALQRYSDQSIGFTIAPTMECNFRCPYCYERGRNYNTMSEEIIESTIKYIKENSKNKESLGITWYGGEPLLAIDIIEKITNGLEDNEKLNYRAALVTNGYLLTKEIALKLKRLHVDDIQITIDGPPEVHNQRRKLPDGSDTFFVILNNIKEVCEILSIVIRVNVDKCNINTVDEILKYIDDFGLQDKVGFYLAPVDDINGTCSSSTCFSCAEFSEEQIEFYQRNQKKGRTFVNIPQYSPGGCGAISKNYIIIDPLGHIYKCWDEIGDIDAKIGDIREAVPLNLNYTKWINYEFLTEAKCLDCKVLPVCLGGCPYKYIKTGKRECHPTKFNVKELVQLVYNTKKTKNSRG